MSRKLSLHDWKSQGFLLQKTLGTLCMVSGLSGSHIFAQTLKLGFLG